MTSKNPLPPGSILDVLASFGVAIPDAAGREKIRIHCVLPDHEDARPSAVVWPESNTYHCSLCGGFSCRSLAEALGVPCPSSTGRASAPALSPLRKPQSSRAPTWTAEDAERVWTVADGNARSELLSWEDQRVFEYLAGRGVLEAEGDFGVLRGGLWEGLPRAVSKWAERGYRVVVPLYSIGTGRLVNVQARSIEAGAQPKTLVPKGSKLSGAAFASESARAVLRGERANEPVLLVEGLTDFLAARVATGVVVLGAPGAGLACKIPGPWCRGRTVLVVLDSDDAGRKGAGRALDAIHRHGGRGLRAEFDVVGDFCEALLALGAEALDSQIQSALAAGEERPHG